jgi:hypothetical protein
MSTAHDTDRLRRAELAKIHIAKKQIGLDHEAYELMVWEVSRDFRPDSPVTSSGDMTSVERKALIQKMQSIGAHSGPPKGEKWIFGDSNEPHIRKLFACAYQLIRDGAIAPSNPARWLRKFVKRLTGVEDPRWTTPLAIGRMLTVKPHLLENSSDAHYHDQCGEDKACLQVSSLFSGMPRDLRERARLIVFQAWIDDSGKEGKAQSPVYVLAGFSAPKGVWEDFADEWQAELKQAPALRYLKASDAYNLEGQFGYDKETKQPSEWIDAHRRGNKNARDERLSKFVEIIAKHLVPPNSYGLSWMLSHREYESTVRRLKALPTATIRDREEVGRFFKNPYYLSFQRILGIELTLRAAQAMFLGRIEKTEILFDEDIDNPTILEEAFRRFVQVVKMDDPGFLNCLQNKTPEYRDDKDNPPLQAADLLAWHIRRMCLNISRGDIRYDDPTWLQLHETSGIKFYDYRYEAADWERILTRVRVTTLARLGLLVPPIR